MAVHPSCSTLRAKIGIFRRAVAVDFFVLVGELVDGFELQQVGDFAYAQAFALKDPVSVIHVLRQKVFLGPDRHHFAKDSSIRAFFILSAVGISTTRTLSKTTVICSLHSPEPNKPWKRSMFHSTIWMP